MIREHHPGQTSYDLHILQEHPAMRMNIVQETTALIMRPTLRMLPCTASHPHPNRLTRFSKVQRQHRSVKRTCGESMHSITQRSHLIRSSFPHLWKTALQGETQWTHFHLFREVVEVRSAARFIEVQDKSAKLHDAMLTGMSRVLPYAQF